MSDSDDELQHTHHELSSTPRILRRLVSKITVKRTRANFIALVYDTIRLVNGYTPLAPAWLRCELTVSLLNELEELDDLSELFMESALTMINLADSGKMKHIRSRTTCLCGFC